MDAPRWRDTHAVEGTDQSEAADITKVENGEAARAFFPRGIPDGAKIPRG